MGYGNNTYNNDNVGNLISSHRGMHDEGVRVEVEFIREDSQGNKRVKFSCCDIEPVVCKPKEVVAYSSGSLMDGFSDRDYIGGEGAYGKITI
jgi:hypothetical protein